MKTVILALLVVLAVSQSEALICECGGNKHCSTPEETCQGSDQVGATVIFHFASRPSYFKGCMESSNCNIMNQPGITTAACCRHDRCNR